MQGINFKKRIINYDKPTLSVMPKPFRRIFKQVLNSQNPVPYYTYVDIIPRDANPNKANLRTTISKKLGSFFAVKGEDHKGIDIDVNTATFKEISNALKTSIEEAKNSLTKSLQGIK